MFRGPQQEANQIEIVLVLPGIDPMWLEWESIHRWSNMWLSLIELTSEWFGKNPNRDFNSSDL